MPPNGSFPTRTFDTLLQTHLEAPKKLIGPIAEGSMGQLYAPRGVGKTLLAMELAISLSTGQSHLLDLHGHSPQWTVPSARPVLYIAGEMSLWTFQQRAKVQLAGRAAPSTLSLLSSGDLIGQKLPGLDLNLPSVRERIWITAKDSSCALIVLDNLDTLMQGAGDEQVWQPVGAWITSLTHSGLAVLVVHHAGKSGDQRGTSTRENPLDYVLRLDPLDDTSERIAFRCTFTKARFVDKLLARSFEAEFLPYTTPHAQWSFRSSSASRLEEFLRIVKIVGRFNYRDVMQEMELRTSRVYQLRSEAVKLGLWEDRWDGRKRLSSPVDPHTQQEKTGKVDK